MCLRLEFSTAKEPKVAEADIQVFKILRLDNRAPFQMFTYKEGETYTVDEEEWSWSKDLCKRWAEVSYGFHSMKTAEDARDFINDRFYYLGGHKIVPMVIPKGAEYFENATEYVSSQLVWPKQEVQSA